MLYILCRMTDTRKTLRFKALSGWRERAVGLLGTNSSAGPVALCPCSSVHTWGMRYALDIALVARNGEVLKSLRAVPPCRVVSVRGAYYALERPAADGPWPKHGSWLGIVGVGTSVGGERHV